MIFLIKNFLKKSLLENFIENDITTIELLQWSHGPRQRGPQSRPRQLTNAHSPTPTLSTHTYSLENGSKGN